MDYAAVTFEQKSKVPARPGHHVQAVPVHPKDFYRPGAYPIRYKDLKASVSIQGIICLLEVQVNLKYDRLTHGHNMLEQLGLKGSGPCPPDRPEPMQHIVKLDGHRELAVEEAGDCLSQYLFNTNNPEVSARPIGNQYDCLTCTLLGQRPIM